MYRTNAILYSVSFEKPSGKQWSRTLILILPIRVRGIVLIHYGRDSSIRPFFLLSVHGLYSLLFSIYNATLIARPCIHSVVSSLEMASYIGAKTGLSFGILQRGIRLVLVVVLGFVIRLRIEPWTWGNDSK